VLAGRYTLRLSVGQTTTDSQHVNHAWDLIKSTAAQIGAGA
jgi:hypothetical protein